MKVADAKQIDPSRYQNLGELSQFLDRHDQWKREPLQALPIVEEFLNRFNFARCSELKQAEKRWEIEAAPRFNTFRALRIERRETKLHSRLWSC